MVVKYRSQLLNGFGAMALALVGLASAEAADYPSQSVRIVVPYSAGGGTDTVARHLSNGLSKYFKESVIVENRPGANGIIGTRAVAEATPDGYTYVLVVNSHLINPLVQKEIPYDTFKDFVGVTMVARSPLAFLVGSNVPAKDLNEFVTLARKPDSKFAYGSSENMTRLVGNMLDHYGKLNMISVSYKGGAPLMADVAGGVTTLGTTSILSANPYVQSGKIRPLAVTGAKRTSAWPDVPTMSELGMKEFDEVYTSYSLYAPAGTPKPILETMQKAVHAVVFAPEMTETLQKQAAEPVADSVDDFNEQVKRDYQFWKSLAEAINLKPL